MAALQTNDAFDHLFDYYGQVYNVDPLLIKTAFHLESSGNPNTPESPAGAVGGMQIMPKLAAHYGIDPRDMTQAIPAAAANLAEGLQASGGDPAGALAYYNGGPRTAQRWKPETQGYVTKALSFYPQMKLTKYADASGIGAPGKTATDASQGAGAGALPDEQAFRSRWGISGTQARPAVDESAFRSRWGISGDGAPGATATQPGVSPPTPTLVSDAATSAPVRIPPIMGDTNVALNRLGGDQFIPNPIASNPSQETYAALRSAVARDPSLVYSQNTPIAMDAAGQPHFALPGAVHDFLGGLVDLVHGPRTGTITPEATNALASGMMLTPGLMRSPANIPGRFSLFPSGTPAAAGEAPGVNPLAAPALEAPTPSFAPSGGRTFEVDPQGNVTAAATPVIRGISQPRSAPPASSEVTSVNPLATASPRPSAPVIAPAPGKTITLSPTEQAGYAAIRTPVPRGAAPTLPGEPPPGAPPLGEPGYTPTTPGLDPATLSPTEAAGYAAIHDNPPPAPMMPPLSKDAAQKVADNLIRHFHSGNPPIAATDVVVPPGYHPTLTGLTNDPGLATLHRGLESVSGAPAVVAQRNAQAINAAAHKLQGDPGDVATMEAAVNAITGPMRTAAFTNKTEMDPQKVQAFFDAANKILSGPDSKLPGAVKYVTQVRDAMRSNAGNGAPETDPEMAYGVHKLINHLLSPVAQNTDADAQAASAALMKLKPLAQTAIESGASGFKDYMKTHAELMKAVDEKRFLQSLNLTSATGDVRLQAIDSAIKNIQKQQQLPGAPKAKWVTPETIDQLTALRNALRMEAARGTGKPINSTTFQNLATNSTVSQIAGNPLASLGLGIFADPSFTGVIGGKILGDGAKSVLARSEAMVKEAILERILNFSGKGEAALAQQPPARSAPWNPLNTGEPSPAAGAAPGWPSAGGGP